VILCLGEVLVDLICERRVRSFAEADSFRPHFGGALANVAVAASRAGAHAGLAAAVGDDQWGRWLRERLEREGVDLRFFELLHGQQTPVAFAHFDRAGGPSVGLLRVAQTGGPTAGITYAPGGSGGPGGLSLGNSGLAGVSVDVLSP
jgi:sugar/nucleoside kinase (ribokinase family)